MIPGEIQTAPGEIELNVGRKTVVVSVANTGDRPIQVGSHYHFYETNEALGLRSRQGLRFPAEHPRRDRRALRAGTEAAPSSWWNWPGTAPSTVSSAKSWGNSKCQRRSAVRLMPRCSARPWAIRVRLADTDLWIEVEKDFTIYGEEVKFGGGKVIRDGMGQSQRRAAEVADTVITNALIVDHWGIVKADIGIKNGRIRRDRQGRQPGHSAQRGHRHRCGHREHRR